MSKITSLHSNVYLLTNLSSPSTLIFKYFVGEEGLDVGGDDCLAVGGAGDCSLHVGGDGVCLDDGNERIYFDVNVDDDCRTVAAGAQVVKVFDACHGVDGVGNDLLPVGRQRHFE